MGNEFKGNEWHFQKLKTRYNSIYVGIKNGLLSHSSYLPSVGEFSSIKND